MDSELEQWLGFYWIDDDEDDFILERGGELNEGLPQHHDDAPQRGPHFLHVQSLTSSMVIVLRFACEIFQ